MTAARTVAAAIPMRRSDYIGLSRLVLIKFKVALRTTTTNQQTPKCLHPESVKQLNHVRRHFIAIANSRFDGIPHWFSVTIVHICDGYWHERLCSGPILNGATHSITSRRRSLLVNRMVFICAIKRYRIAVKGPALVTTINEIVAGYDPP